MEFSWRFSAKMGIEDKAGDFVYATGSHVNMAGNPLNTATTQALRVNGTLAFTSTKVKPNPVQLQNDLNNGLD